MYKFVISADVLSSMKAATATAAGIADRIEDLANNPLARAKKTEIPAIGQYYINAGRYCILFDIDEASNEIRILAVVLSAYLFKILVGRIQPPENPLASIASKAIHINR